MKKKNDITIVTVDIYSDKSYKLSHGRFSILKKIKRNKDDILVSYISNRDLILESVDVSQHIPEENIIDVITDKVYEELRLDPAIEYGIYPIKTALKSDEIKYQVLIVDQNSLKESFAPIAKKVKVIDYIIPAPLLYKVLYQTKKLKDKTTDMFIYFGEYDSFITFYHKGEYLYSKTINFSLQQMYDRFCQLAQDVPLKKEQFRELLEGDNLKNLEGKNKELIVSVLNECFLTINDVLIFTKRTYDIQDIKTAYVGFSWGYMSGIETYVSNYLNLDGKALSLAYSNEDPAISIDPMHALMAMSAYEDHNGVLDIPNLTPYPRPLPFKKRPASKILSLFFLILFLFLLPIIYNYFIGLTTQAQNLTLSKKEAKLTKLANEYKRKINEKKDKLKALQKMVDKTEKLYLEKKGELKNVYNKKFKYSLRSEQLALITRVLKEFDIKSKFIEISDTVYKIEVESKDDKEITAFIKKLVSKFDTKISNVNIKDIKLDPKTHLYKGVLKIEFMKGQE